MVKILISVKIHREKIPRPPKESNLQDIQIDTEGRKKICSERIC